MDFYQKFDEAKNLKAFKLKDVAELLHKEYDTVRMAVKRQSFTELEKKIITERYFGNKSTGDENNISVKGSFEHEFYENKNFNKFIKLPNGQHYMLMPLAEVKIQAGLLDNFKDLEFLSDLPQHGILVDKPVHGRYVAFIVSGDSMEDGSDESIKRDNIVSTRELQRQHWVNKLRYKDFPYWVIYTTQSKMPLLKQIIDHNVEEGYIVCHSLNDSPEYTDFKLHMNDVQALFYVVDINRTVSKKIIY